MKIKRVAKRLIKRGLKELKERVTDHYIYRSELPDAVKRLIDRHL